MPDTLVNIAPFAFASCHSIPSIDIPPSVKEISFYAFGECENLCIPEIPDTVKVASTAFNGCGISEDSKEAVPLETSNDKFSTSNIRRIDNLPIDEYNTVIENMTEDEREEYFSKSSLCGEPMHPIVVDSIEDELEGCIEASEFLDQMKKKYGIGKS